MNKDKQPDTFRMAALNLDKNKSGDSFSVCAAAKTPALSGINKYRIAEIMRDMCFQANDSDVFVLNTEQRTIH